MKPVILLFALMFARDAALDPPRPVPAWRNWVNEVLEDHHGRIHQLEQHVATLTEVNQRQNELIKQLEHRVAELEHDRPNIDPPNLRPVTRVYTYKTYHRRCGLLWRWRCR